jgi:hypothetical protein
MGIKFLKNLSFSPGRGQGCLFFNHYSMACQVITPGRGNVGMAWDKANAADGSFSVTLLMLS